MAQRLPKHNLPGLPAWPLSAGILPFQRWRLSTAACGSSIDHSLEHVASSLAGPADCIADLRTKNQQLRASLKKLAWPKLLRFEVQGKSYPVPIQGRDVEMLQIEGLSPQARLRYLAGFFDGDGCVACNTGLSGCRLEVGQSYDHADVLILFCNVLGGSIGAAKPGSGLKKPLLTWTVCGESARFAACLLAQHSICKQKQLLLAAAWPEEKRRREDCADEIRSLKHSDSAVPGKGSWEYWAGFFDAEGYVNLRRHSSLLLAVKQKHITVLQCLQRFIHQEFEVEPAIYSVSGIGAYELKTSGTFVSKQCLGAMLQAGLLRKAKQAELCMHLQHDNASEIRSRLTEMTGNQMYGRTLNETGVERSQKIQAEHKKKWYLARRGRLPEAEIKLKEIEGLKLEHELLKARHEKTKLLEYRQKIRALHQDSWIGP